MKSTSLLVIMFFSLTLFAFATIMVEAAAAADPVIVGKWDRTDGEDKYTIYADGVTETVLSDGTHHGIWEMDGSSGYDYIFSWDFGPSEGESFVDYVTVAADGQSYSGVNNYGDAIHCVRIGDAESGGFPIVYVAVGGGIVAVTIIGAAAYWYFIAGKTSETSVINEWENAFLHGNHEIADASNTQHTQEGQQNYGQDISGEQKNPQGKQVDSDNGSG